MTLLETMMRKGILTRPATATIAATATPISQKPKTAPQKPESVAIAAVVAVAAPSKPEKRVALASDLGLPFGWAEALTILCTMPPPRGLTTKVWNDAMADGLDALRKQANRNGEKQ